MNKITIIVIIVLSIFIILNIKYINTTKSNIEILQVNNPNKDIYEKTVSQKSPSIFTNIITSNIRNNILSLIKSSKTQELHLELSKYFDYYLIPMSIKNLYSIQTNNIVNLKQVGNFRFLIYQLSGESRIIIFNPKNKSYLYPSKKNGETMSHVDFWNQDLKRYPNFSKAEYVEIILYPGQLIYLPYKWWYCINSVPGSIRINSISDSLFSYFLRF